MLELHVYIYQAFVFPCYPKRHEYNGLFVPAFVRVLASSGVPKQRFAFQESWATIGTQVRLLFSIKKRTTGNPRQVCPELKVTVGDSCGGTSLIKQAKLYRYISLTQRTMR